MITVVEMVDVASTSNKPLKSVGNDNDARDGVSGGNYVDNNSLQAEEIMCKDRVDVDAVAERDELLIVDIQNLHASC
jgi:hypothetical protein